MSSKHTAPSPNFCADEGAAALGSKQSPNANVIRLFSSGQSQLTFKGGQSNPKVGEFT